MSVHQLEIRERVIRGEKNWWFLGPGGGVARLRDHHLTAEGSLRASAEGYLRERGMFSVPAQNSYALTVLTSTDCNLGCGYCFQNVGQDASGGNRPPRIAHSRLTSERITSILEFASHQMEQSELAKLHLLLFGGEPLLNKRGCCELLARAGDYGLASAAMISNLTLLTPRLARQLSDLGLRSVQVTFDGDRSDHDQIRVRRSHGGTFDTIVRNLVCSAEAAPRIRWSLRINVSHRNYSGIDALLDRLAAAVDSSRCRVHFARVGDVGVGYSNDLMHTGELIAWFSRWQRRALELGFSVTRPSASLPCRTCGFGDGRFGAVVNADGILASCWETAGKPGWDVGSITTGYLPSEQAKDRWISCEDMYKYSDDDQAITSFKDSVDAALLDFMDATGRL